MRVNSASFVKSVMDAEDCPRQGWPEFAFVGRSNVGKSSLMNCLLGRKGLAKTSGSPGKTRTINFFEVNEKIHFVDLPGYGYAKVPKNMRDQWVKVMSGYLMGRDPLRLVVQLVDARHKPTDKDQEMLDLLERAEVPTLVAATKIDKVKRSQRQRNLNLIRATLELDEDALIVPFSAVTREGKNEIWRVIDDLSTS